MASEDGFDSLLAFVIGLASKTPITLIWALPLSCFLHRQAFWR